MSASDVKIRDIGGGLMLYATDEYDRLVEFFVKNQLEFDGDEEVDTDIVRWTALPWIRRTGKKK